MNGEFPLIIIVRYHTCSILILIVISALQHVPLLKDRIYFFTSASWDWSWSSCCK